jgi:hypothetical protein
MRALGLLAIVGVAVVVGIRLHRHHEHSLRAAACAEYGAIEQVHDLKDLLANEDATFGATAVALAATTACEWREAAGQREIQQLWHQAEAQGASIAHNGIAPPTLWLATGAAVTRTSIPFRLVWLQGPVFAPPRAMLQVQRRRQGSAWTTSKTTNARVMYLDPSLAETRQPVFVQPGGPALRICVVLRQGGVLSPVRSCSGPVRVSIRSAADLNALLAGGGRHIFAYRSAQLGIASSADAGQASVVFADRTESVPRVACPRPHGACIAFASPSLSTTQHRLVFDAGAPPLRAMFLIDVDEA